MYINCIFINGNIMAFAPQKTALTAIRTVWNSLKGLFFVGSSLADRHVRPAREGGFNMVDAGLFAAAGLALCVAGWAVANGSLIAGGFLLAKSTSVLANAGILAGMGFGYFVAGTALQAIGFGAAFEAGKKIAANTGLDDKIDDRMTRLFGRNWERLREMILRQIPKKPEPAATVESEAPAAAAAPLALAEAEKKKSFFTRMAEASAMFNTAGAKYGIPPVYIPQADNQNQPPAARKSAQAPKRPS